MRVISGEYGGRKLKSLSGNVTRPTTDKVKEAIFNIIGPYFDGGVCIDLYAGSGGLSIEAVSRGIDKAILFEKNREAQQTILENIAITKQPEKFELVRGDSKVNSLRINTAVDLIFLDPPYHQQTIIKDIERLLQLDIIKSSTLIICETDAQIVLPETIAQVKQFKRNVYGTIAVTFYEVSDND